MTILADISELDRAGGEVRIRHLFMAAQPDQAIMFRHEDGGFESAPILHRDSQGDSDFWRQPQ